MSLKKLLLASLALCLGGCSLEAELNVAREEAKHTDAGGRFKISRPPSWRELAVIVIDDCQYLYGYVGGNGGYVLCHKGNCNNPAHVYNGEKPE